MLWRTAVEEVGVEVVDIKVAGNIAAVAGITANTTTAVVDITTMMVRARPSRKASIEVAQDRASQNPAVVREVRRIPAVIIIRTEQTCWPPAGIPPVES